MSELVSDTDPKLHPYSDKEAVPPLAAGTDPIWTILPSYAMYLSIFNNDHADPPQYDVGSCSEIETHNSSTGMPTIGTGSSTAVSEMEVGVDRLSYNDPTFVPTTDDSSHASLIIADESTTSWRETILDNIHNLRNFTATDNANAKAITLSVHFTEDVCEVGKVPTHIDPLNFEYKQGDYLNGYVLIRNDGPKEIPFDMFYVLFEGTFAVQDKSNPKGKSRVTIRRFLEMYDFAASYYRANVNRLVSEKDTGWYCDSNRADPLDGTLTALGGKQVLRTGVTYKRFFTFKIPVRLLDTECNDHKLDGHTELPPTLGMPDWERKLRPKEKLVSDFSMMNTSTSYGVTARFIGKASKYDVDEEKDFGTKLINEAGDEFIILKEAMSNVRILQDSVILSESEKAAKKTQSKLLYNNMLKRINEKIAVGEELVRAIKSGDDGKAVSLSRQIEAENLIRERSQTDTVKFEQLYRASNRGKDSKNFQAKPDTYDMVIPITKKPLLGKAKEEGTLMISVPKTEYLLQYISPKYFREHVAPNDSSWKFQIPVEVKFTASSLLNSNVKPPSIREIRAEFVVFTVKSDRRPIPIELNHDFLFQNESKMQNDMTAGDNFTTLVKKPMQKHARTIYNLIQELGSNNFRVEKDLCDDLSALANVNERYNNLILHDTKVIQHGGRITSASEGTSDIWEQLGCTFTKIFSVEVDVTRAQKKSPSAPKLKPGYKSYNEMCFVPSFQTCMISRLYYIQLFVFFSNEKYVALKLPVSIAKL